MKTLLIWSSSEMKIKTTVTPVLDHNRTDKEPTIPVKIKALHNIEKETIFFKKIKLINNMRNDVKESLNKISLKNGSESNIAVEQDFVS